MLFNFAVIMFLRISSLHDQNVSVVKKCVFSYQIHALNPKNACTKITKYFFWKQQIFVIALIAKLWLKNDQNLIFLLLMQCNKLWELLKVFSKFIPHLSIFSSKLIINRNFFISFFFSRSRRTCVVGLIGMPGRW